MCFIAASLIAMKPLLEQVAQSRLIVDFESRISSFVGSRRSKAGKSEVSLNNLPSVDSQGHPEWIRAKGDHFT